MAIVAGDIKKYLSGGGSNTDPAASIGGAISTTEVPAGLFDDVSSVEAAAGDVEYRCFYVKNTHGSLPLTGAKLWIQTQTPSADTSVAVAVGAAAMNAAETAVANEGTAPSGPTFSTPTDFASGIALGDIPAGQFRSVWVRRTTTAGATVAADSFKLRVQGDTAP